ncbi:MAG: hypothetical protein ACTSUE_05000, partial [Promethearchaeota archaeon]
RPETSPFFHKYLGRDPKTLPSYVEYCTPMVQSIDFRFESSTTDIRAFFEDFCIDPETGEDRCVCSQYYWGTFFEYNARQIAAVHLSETDTLYNALIAYQFLLSRFTEGSVIDKGWAGIWYWGTWIGIPKWWIYLFGNLGVTDQAAVDVLWLCWMTNLYALTYSIIFVVFYVIIFLSFGVWALAVVLDIFWYAEWGVDRSFEATQPVHNKQRRIHAQILAKNYNQLLNQYFPKHSYMDDNLLADFSYANKSSSSSPSLTEPLLEEPSPGINKTQAKIWKNPTQRQEEVPNKSWGTHSLYNGFSDIKNAWNEGKNSMRKRNV